MTNENLMRLVNETNEEIITTLGAKGLEYSTYDDRLSNFKEAANFLNTIPEDALLGFVAKHIIALKDFIFALDVNEEIVSKEQWMEKTGDIIAYMILLRALLRERGII